MVGASGRVRPGPRALVVGGVFVGVVAFLLRDAVFLGQVLYRRDVTMQWVPLVDIFVRCVGHGALPLWDPWSGFGRPLLADPRAEILYPLTWLNLILPVGLYLTLFTVIHLLLAGLGCFALARRLGASAATAVAAGVAWVASGPVLSLTSQWHNLAGAAWLPWILWATDRVLEKRGLRRVLTLGLVVALQGLTGAPDFTILLFPTWAVFCLARLGPAAARPRRRLVLALAGAGAIAVTITALQWAPTLSSVTLSERGGLSEAERTAWSLHPALLAETVLPARWMDLPLNSSAIVHILDGKEPFLHSHFLSPFVLVLAFAAVAIGGRLRLALGLILLGNVLLAVGRHTPFHALAAAVYPPLGLSRFPAKAIVLAGLAAALLAALALDEAGRRGLSGRARLAVISMMAALAALVAMAIVGLQGQYSPVASLLHTGAPGWPSVRDATLWRIVVVSVLTLLALAASAWRQLPSRSLTAVMVCGLAPLLWTNKDVVDTAPRSLHALRPPVLADLGDLSVARVYVYDYSRTDMRRLDTNPGIEKGTYLVARMPGGWNRSQTTWLGAVMALAPPTAARWGLAGSFNLDAPGMDPLWVVKLDTHLRSVEDQPRIHTRLLQMAGVTHAVALFPGTWTRGLIRRASLPGFFERPILLYEVPRPQPRAFLVDSTSVLSDEAALERMDAEDFDPRHEAILAHGEVITAPGVGTAGDAHVTTWRPDHLRVAVSARRRAYLIVTDRYDPGWKALVDGHPAPLERANVAFRGILVPPGSHEVDLRYRPPAVVWGAATSGIGLIVLLGLALATRRQNREG
jgi:hypothetical protein